MRRAAPLLALLLLLPVSAGAQEAQIWGAPEVVEVEAAPGPAVWHLTRGDSEVWVLGTVGAMPEGMTWNKQYLADLLDGARAVLTAPRPSIGIFEGAWFLIRHGDELSLPRHQSLEAILPDAMRARFIATRTSLGEDEGEYRTDTPIRAALRLQQDFMKKYKMAFGEPGETLRKLARAKNVKLGPVSRFEILDAAEDVLKLNMDQQRICLAQSVEDIDRQEAHAQLAASAWAVGDVKAVKANYAQSRLADCVIGAVNSVANISERVTADYTSAIDAALDQPGKTIAVIDVGPLLAKDGVLERLKAKGVAIEGPAD